MGKTALLLFSSLAAEIWGQTRTPGFGAQPIPRPPVSRPMGAVWGGWGGWGWWNPEPIRVVVQTPVEKEKRAAPVVVNREYVAERYSPRMTEVALAPAAVVTPEWKACGVKLIGGERFEGALCAEVDDALLVKSAAGRRYRFSRDLVDSIQ